MDTHQKPFAAQQPERIRLSGQTKCKLRSSTGERLWPAGEGELGLRKITPSVSKFRVPAAPFTGPLKSPVKWG